MDNRPIGFFDSGLGGLTCIPYVLSALPRERIVYFGDTARTPYGSKAPATIRKFALEIADFLVEAQGVKLLVVACNTISATAIGELRARHPDIPILGIISPASHAVAKSCTQENRIGVIGTKATIASGAYSKKILGLAGDLHIRQQACPAFVPLIEEGIIENHIMDLTIKYYLDDFLRDGRVDTLVLGCTHYPLIRANIERLYPGLRIIDPSEEMLASITDELQSAGLRAGGAAEGRADAGATDIDAADAGAADTDAADAGAANKGTVKPGGCLQSHAFFASDLSENFVNMIDLIFSGTGFPATFETFDLEGYLERKG